MLSLLLPSARGSQTDSAAGLSSEPDSARRPPPDLPVWKTKATVIFSNIWSQSHLYIRNKVVLLLDLYLKIRSCFIVFL